MTNIISYTLAKLYFKDINVKDSYSTWTSLAIFAYMKTKKKNHVSYLHLSKQEIISLTHPPSFFINESKHSIKVKAKTYHYENFTINYK